MMISIVVQQCYDGWYVSVNNYGSSWFYSWAELFDVLCDYLQDFTKWDVSITVR